MRWFWVAVRTERHTNLTFIAKTVNHDPMIIATKCDFPLTWLMLRTLHRLNYTSNYIRVTSHHAQYRFAGTLVIIYDISNPPHRETSCATIAYTSSRLQLAAQLPCRHTIIYEPTTSPLRPFWQSYLELDFSTSCQKWFSKGFFRIL